VVAGRLTARGRLDRTTAHLVHDATVAMLATDGRHWRVDVAELVVGDRFGLRALTGAYRRLLRQGRRMSLEGTSPELLQALTRLRLDHHLLPPPFDPLLGSATDAEPTPEG
jgi:anti-anti-sigma regulatory factor